VRVDPDRELVIKAKGGDLSAFEVLVERHSDVVFRVAARTVGPDDALDISQDSFLRALSRIGSYREEGSFRAWLLQITHNTAVNAVLRKQAEPVDELPEPGSGDPEPPIAGERQPAVRLERQERRRRLELKLRGLRMEHRTVLVLRDVEGMSYEEIAQVTGTPLGSVKGRLHRARTELIDALRRNTYDWELPK
jgi:RNA polymerase sigma-70 factor (ECF subfamily)